MPPTLRSDPPCTDGGQCLFLQHEDAAICPLEGSDADGAAGICCRGWNDADVLPLLGGHIMHYYLCMCDRVLPPE